MNATAAEARRALDSNPVWYHSIELAPGSSPPARWISGRSRRGSCPTTSPVCERSTSAPSTASGPSRWSVAAPRSWRSTSSSWRRPSGRRSRRSRLEREAGERGVELGRGFELAAERARLGGRAPAGERLRALRRGDRRAGRLRVQRRDPASPARPGAGAGADRRRAAPGRPSCACWSRSRAGSRCSARGARRLVRGRGSRASIGGCRTSPRSAAGCGRRACARSGGWRS